MAVHTLVRFDRQTPWWDGMVALAAVTAPGFDAADYLGRRAEHYDRVAMTTEGESLLAFQLVEEFEERGERHVYLGPLFSRGSAATTLFLWLFDGLLSDPRPFHLLTEVQSPRVALLFKRLLPTASWPRLQGEVVPVDVSATVRRYARNIDHIGELDPFSLSTRHEETLYRGPEGYEAVVGWLARRGVDLARGDAQILVTSVGASAADRAAVRFEVWQGTLALSDWSACKADTLSWFERSDLPETTVVEVSA